MTPVPNIYFKPPYERTSHLIGADFRVIRKYLTVKNSWPRFLYKYKNCQPEHLRNLIVDSCFYMSSRHQLNDPFDVSSEVEFIDGGVDRNAYLNYLYKQFRTRHKDRKEIARRLDSPEKIQKEIRRHLREAVDTTGFHSFATCPRNLLLWSHYADSHKGVCLVYETARDLDTFVHALPVKYSKDFPVIQFTTSVDHDLIRKAFLTKSIDWKYENERRIFDPKRAGQSLLYKPQALVGIVLGAKISMEDRGMVMDLIADRNSKGLPSLTIYESVCQNMAYAVKIYRQKITA